MGAARLADVNCDAKLASSMKLLYAIEMRAYAFPLTYPRYTIRNVGGFVRGGVYAFDYIGYANGGSSRMFLFSDMATYWGALELQNLGDPVLRGAHPVFASDKAVRAQAEWIRNLLPELTSASDADHHKLYKQLRAAGIKVKFRRALR
jgi:hypothetical protein